MNKESHNSVQKFKSAFCLNSLTEPIVTLPDNFILQHRNSLTKLKKKSILKVTSNKKQPTIEKVSGHRLSEEEIDSK